MDTLLKPHVKNDVDDKLIPLINIVFLLLIFFMVAGQISQQQDPDIDPPVATSETPMDRPEHVLEISKDKALIFNGVILEMPLLAKALSALTAEQKNTLAIKADKNVSADDLNRILTLLREQQVRNIRLYAQQQDQS